MTNVPLDSSFLSQWTARVLTLYPEMFPGHLGYSLAGRALKSGIWGLDVINIRSYTQDKHHTVDDTPYGGGSGMVIKPDVIANCIDHAVPKSSHLVYLSPRGEALTQSVSVRLSKMKDVTFICGRFEGLDQRVIDAYDLEEISIGDFILSGGETGAFAIIDSVVRLLTGVMGNTSSITEESFNNNLLEYPLYTKPQNWNGLTVPEVLLSGNHKKIDAWRREQAENITKIRRPDLWAQYSADMKKRP